MKKGYQGDELWTAVNPLSGKRELVDSEGEFIPGEAIVKLYYCKRLDGYVTFLERRFFQSRGKRLHAQNDQLRNFSPLTSPNLGLDSI
jgi:hypothetical protein